MSRRSTRPVRSFLLRAGHKCWNGRLRDSPELDFSETPTAGVTSKAERETKRAEPLMQNPGLVYRGRRGRRRGRSTRREGLPNM